MERFPFIIIICILIFISGCERFDNPFMGTWEAFYNDSEIAYETSFHKDYTWHSSLIFNNSNLSVVHQRNGSYLYDDISLTLISNITPSFSTTIVYDCEFVDRKEFYLSYIIPSSTFITFEKYIIHCKKIKFLP